MMITGLSTRMKLAWLASILATALLSAGLLGPGTGAVWSDSVSVAHQITTGHLKLKLVAVDGGPLTPPADEYRLEDTIRGAKADVTRVLELRNDGTLDIGSLVLTTTPSPGDVPLLAQELTVTVDVTDEAGTTSAARTLAEWEAGPHPLRLGTVIEPGETVTVTLRVSGKLTGHEKDSGVRPVYTFTGSEE